MNMNLVIAALGAALIFVAVAFGLQFLYGYRVKNRAIEVVLVHALPIYRLPIENIESIRKVSWKELGVGGTALRLGNRFTGECVLIQTRNGWFRRIVITPNDVDEFINQVVTVQQAAPLARSVAGVD